MQYIYILELQQGKYYVGKTKDITKRINEHRSGKTSEWTRKYPMVKLLNSWESNDTFDEDKETKKLMLEKGIDNVRGGSYSRIELDEEDKRTIERERRGALNLCQRCGKSGHMIRDCKEGLSYGRRERVVEEVVRQIISVEKVVERRNKKVCERCGRDTHTIKNCYAQFHLNGEALPCGRCGRDSHITDECYAKTDLDGNLL